MAIVRDPAAPVTLFSQIKFLVALDPHLRPLWPQMAFTAAIALYRLGETPPEWGGYWPYGVGLPHWMSVVDTPIHAQWRRRLAYEVALSQADPASFTGIVVRFQRGLRQALIPEPVVPTWQIAANGSFYVEEDDPKLVPLGPAFVAKVDQLDAFCRELVGRLIAAAPAGQIIVSGRWGRRVQRIPATLSTLGGIRFDFVDNAVVLAGEDRRYEGCTVERIEPLPESLTEAHAIPAREKEDVQGIDPPTTGEPAPTVKAKRAVEANKRPKPPTKKDVQKLFDDMIASAKPLPSAIALRQWAIENSIAVRRLPDLRKNCPDKRLHKRGRRPANPD
jgi:hypothetical protein